MKNLLACLVILAPFILSAQWNANADVDQDGCIGVNDILEVLSLFGECQPAWQCGDTLNYHNYSYSTVLIGDQCWFAENLRTATYTDGSVIPSCLTVDEWTSTTSGATAVFGEGSSPCYDYSPDIDACDEAQSLAAYGRLYNWYAVDDTRGLCPSGWHVPTDDEWTELEGYIITSLGFPGFEGEVLKSTTGWCCYGNGTDDFGFSALPGGFRDDWVGDFGSAEEYGFWWSSSLYDEYAWFRSLSNNHFGIIQAAHPIRYGYSVRCLRDAE